MYLHRCPACVILSIDIKILHHTYYIHNTNDKTSVVPKQKHELDTSGIWNKEV